MSRESMTREEAVETIGSVSDMLELVASALTDAGGQSSRHEFSSVARAAVGMLEEASGDLTSALDALSS